MFPAFRTGLLEREVLFISPTVLQDARIVTAEYEDLVINEKTAGERKINLERIYRRRRRKIARISIGREKRSSRKIVDKCRERQDTCHRVI